MPAALARLTNSASNFFALSLTPPKNVVGITVPLPLAPMRIASSESAIVEPATSRPLWPCRRSSCARRIAASGPEPTPIRSVGVAFNCDTCAARSNAWVWNVTAAFISVPAAFMMFGSTISPMVLEMTSSVA